MLSGDLEARQHGPPPTTQESQVVSSPGPPWKSLAFSHVNAKQIWLYCVCFPNETRFLAPKGVKRFPSGLCKLGNGRHVEILGSLPSNPREYL